MNDPKIFPLGDNALTIEWGQEIDPALNERAISFADALENSPFGGFVEAVPAYASATTFYDPVEVRALYPEFPTAFEAVKAFVEQMLDEKGRGARKWDGRVVEIPFRISEEYSPDLDYIAEHSGLSPPEVVETFTAPVYRVYMLGFMPGFAYMGEVDDRIAVPRKQTPRLKVAAGSVGIAGRQTGVYSLDSPGGWQIIGRTGTKMFTPDEDMPCPLRPGDMVRFVVE